MLETLPERWAAYQNGETSVNRSALATTDAVEAAELQ